MAQVAESPLELEDEDELEHEAATADADDDDDDDDDETAEPEALAAALEGINPEAFEKEQRRHEREMRKLLGDAFSALEGCAPCGATGYVPIGFEPPPEPLFEPGALRCDTCNGYGFRRTPSLAPGQETMTCPTCNGAGWQSEQQVTAARIAADYAAQAAVTSTPPAPTWDASRQTWITPEGAPIYAPPAPPMPGAPGA